MCVCVCVWIPYLILPTRMDDKPPPTVSLTRTPPPLSPSRFLLTRRGSLDDVQTWMGAPDEVVLLACRPTREHTIPYLQPLSQVVSLDGCLGFYVCSAVTQDACCESFIFFPYGERRDGWHGCLAL